MNIELGMYVRTEKCEIDKVIRVFEDYRNNIKYETKRKYLSEHEILKASFNIIDLIEVGDLVNDKIVIDSSVTGYIEFIYDDVIGNGQIKTITTHEQIKANEFKVEV